MNETVLAVCSGVAGAAVIKLLDNIIMWILGRKAAKEDKDAAKACDLDVKIDRLTERIDISIKADKLILFDRIQYLGQGYVKAEVIDIDDRHRLNELFECYENDLGDGGDLNVLMNQVNRLPLK